MNQQSKQESPSKDEAAKVGSPLPRSVKYAWGVAVSVLLLLSLLVDKDSPFIPVINQAIDVLQQQRTPSENK